MKFNRGLGAALACWLWLAACCGVASWRFMQGVPVDTDIQSMLPSGGRDDVERTAVALATSAAASRMAVLVDAEQAELAQAAADALETALTSSGYFRPDRLDMEPTGRWLFANRNQLLCETDAAAFGPEQGARLARRALADIYSLATPVTGDLLIQDPFLLTLRLGDCLSPVTPPAQDGGSRLVSGRIVASAFRLDAQEAVVDAFETWQEEWSQQGVTAARAGAIFHADAAAARAKNEMSLIGAIGTIGVSLLFFAVFRTMRSVIQALVLVGIGLAAGLGATLLVFPSIHVLVFVFAAMLVGIVSDYAVHTLASGPATRWADTGHRLRLVGRPVTVSMITTVLGFGGLAAFGVPLFQQVALLSGVGVFTAWAFVLFVLVPADRAPRRADALAAWWGRLEDMREAFRIPSWLSWSVAALMVVLGVWGALNFRTLDDVRQFQPRSVDLAAEEEIVRSAGYDGSGVRFLLSRGASLEEAREREEAALANAPDDLGILASTRFDPSVTRRVANTTALDAALYRPHLGAHAERLGLDPAAVDRTLAPDAPPPGWLEGLRGEVDGTYFLVAPVLGSTDWSGPAVDGVRLIDPAEQYSEAFRAYSGYALIALAAAFGCGLIAVLVVYRQLAAISILVPALVAVVLALLVQIALGFPLTFFSYASTLVLVGVGVDYAAFQWEAGQRSDRWTAVAVTVDAATTLLSMGMLILSTTYPVRSFGLTVTIGIVAALCLSHIPRLVAQGRFGRVRRHRGDTKR